MPFHWFSLDPVSPNPGRWHRGRIAELCRAHGARLEGFWVDREHDARTAYVLVEDGDADGLEAALHASERLELFPGPDAP
jgi:hypothetical protein